MTAKMRSKPYRKNSRLDWEDVKVKVMKWCLRVKLIENWRNFSELLLSTGDRPIVEESRKDSYWGARRQENDTLNGQNVLGRLLMELRKKLQEDSDALRSVQPLKIPNFCLLGEPIPILIFPPQQETVLVGADDEEPAQRAFL